MSNKSPNEFHWKNKLEDVSGLSTETVTDKNAAWERLHNRLRKKPRRIKAVWYYAAAACLLLVLTIPLFTANKKQHTLVKNDPAPTRSEKTTAPVISPSKENAAIVISPSLIEKKKIIKTTLQTNHKRSPDDIVKKEETAPHFNDQKEVGQEPVVTSPVIDSPVETALAIAPFKKKLKVVHINELGESLEETPNIVRYYERHSFQLRLLNSQANTSSSLPLNNTGFTFFKPEKRSIKLN